MEIDEMADVFLNLVPPLGLYLEPKIFDKSLKVDLRSQFSNKVHGCQKKTYFISWKKTLPKSPGPVRVKAAYLKIFLYTANMYIFQLCPLSTVILLYVLH